MPDEQLCSDCGAKLSPDIQGGLCVRCLFTLGQKNEAGTESAAPVGHITEKEGDRIGRYKLLQKIGEGGCGVVYMADQEEPIRRRVALKVIKPGMDTRAVIARFEAERQALAMMDHPNIAKVLDVGQTATGRPFFVMELVKGVRITEYCDQNNLPTRERLALFTQVCHAIQHAHQKGIIHRDIKPSNILVTLHDGVPVPKVIDFGIAKALHQQRLTDLTLFTAFGQFMGTPAYMSPEQAEMSGLDIDTRCDIYALGVLLYELLVGQVPFDGAQLLQAGLDEMRRIIREQNPVLPSAHLSTLAVADLTLVARHRQCEPARLTHLVRGDLDWIVMKCLEKDRTRRYETSSGLAADIQRHLHNEPVLASPPSNLYRFQKMVRRNKFAFAACGAVMLVIVVAVAIQIYSNHLTASAVMAALIIGLGLSTWLFLRERKVRMRAVKAEKGESQLRQHAETAVQIEARLRQEAEAISTFLTEVFQSPDPVRDGRTITVAETLEHAALKLDTDLANQPVRRAQLQSTLGHTYSALGLPREAIPLREKARDYFLASQGPAHPDTLRAMNNLASSYHDAGRLDEALHLGDEALALHRKVLGPEHPNTLWAMHNLAVFYHQAGHRDESLKLKEEVLALHRKVLGPEHPKTLNAMGNLAQSYRDAGHRDESLKLLEEVMALHCRVNGPEHSDTLLTMGNLAASYHDAGRRGEALKLQEELLAHHRKVLGPEHPDTLMAMGNLAASYHDAGRRDEALKMREEVLTLSRKVLGPEHPATLMAMGKLAQSYHHAGRRDEALKLQEEVLALRQKVLGLKHPDTHAAMSDLAATYHDAGRRDEALKLQEEVLALRQKVLGLKHPDTLLAMGNLAATYHDAGRRDEALKMEEAVVALRRKVYDPKHPDTLTAMNNLAASYHDAGRRDEALKLQEDVLALRRKVNGPEHPDTLTAMHNLALFYFGAGRRDEALKLQEEVLALRRKVLGPEHTDTLRAMTSLVISYGEARRLTEAIELQEQSLAIQRRVLPAGLRYFAVALGNMASLYGTAGREQEAEAMRKELADIKAKAENQKRINGKTTVPPAKP